MPCVSMSVLCLPWAQRTSVHCFQPSCVPESIPQRSCSSRGTEQGNRDPANPEVVTNIASSWLPKGRTPCAALGARVRAEVRAERAACWSAWEMRLRDKGSSRYPVCAASSGPDGTHARKQISIRTRNPCLNDRHEQLGSYKGHGHA